MELKEAIRSRRSIRGYSRKSVPLEIIKEIISNARWAPSWGNTQPWEIIVATGESSKRFKEKNKELLLSGKPANPHISMPQSWPKKLKQRYKNLGKSVLRSLGIDRQDHAARLEHFGHMFALFEAPALVLITIDKELSLEYAMLDVGIFLQTFCLLAHDKGLGTCILAVSVSYPEFVQEIFSIPEDKLLVIGVALGWPDSNDPINRFKRERGSIEEFVRWVNT